MELEKRALYNLIRLNWLADPEMDVEPWAVEDYRSWDTADLFEELAELGGPSDGKLFLVYVEQCESPEDLPGCFLEEEYDPKTEDKLYLVAFELWRRLAPEKITLSIYCDELDHLLEQYEHGQSGDEGIQKALAQLQSMLDENVDDGGEPAQVYGEISDNCAHDIEAFLYDYISDLIENGHSLYASELIEGFIEYMLDCRWFEFLSARVLAGEDIDQANHLLEEVISDDDPPNVDLNLEILEFLSHTGDRTLFLELARKSADLIETEEDLTDLLSSCLDYYRCLDYEEPERAVEALIEEAKRNSSAITDCDPRVSRLKAILQ